MWEAALLTASQADTAQTVDEAITEAAKETISIGEQFLSNFYDIVQYLRENGGYILWDLLAVVFFLLAAKGILLLFSSFTRHVMENPQYHRTESQGKRVDTLMTLTRSIARYVVYFIALLLILNQFGLARSMSSLIAAAGVGSLAIGFGAQNLVKDVVTGLFMMFENQFAVGDYIKTDEAEGTVEATAMRVTYLRSLKGDQIIVPNGSISRVVNYTRGGYVASITVSTAYEADTRTVIAVIDKAVQDYAKEHTELIEAEPVVLGITAFGESSVDIGVTCKVKPMKQWEVERGMRLAVKEAFDAQGVEFPYPHLVTMAYTPPDTALKEVAIDGRMPEREIPDWANAVEDD